MSSYNPYRRKKLNKILAIIAIILIVIAIIAVIWYMVLIKNKKPINDYTDKIIAKNYFEQMTIDLNTKQVKRDEIETTLKDEFEISEEQQNLILSSIEEINNFFENTTFNVELKDGTVSIVNPYQTKTLILQANEIKDSFDAEEEIQIQEGLYILKYDTQARTKAAYEYLSQEIWMDNLEIDEIFTIEPINDESQTVYGEVNIDDGTSYKSHGVTAMGLDNYQKIINENGNASEIIISTIGYGAAIDNSYFKDKISDKYYNFIDNSKDVHESIPQGSRILEVIKESTTNNIKILPLVVINDEGYTSISSIIQAISYAIQNSDVICYEFIQEENEIINLMLEKAFKENVPLCCVTKNVDGEEKLYPASTATTIAVSSIDKSSKATTYSGRGDYIDFVAYSTDVEEIFNTSSSVSKWSGAQYSTAHIASLIGLIKTYNKQYTIIEVYNWIRNYCKDLGNEGKDNIYGYGCPNVSELKISDLDKQSPEIKQMDINTENWELLKFLQIKATDNIRIFGWAITKTNEAPKEWNTLKDISNNLDVTEEIEENGTYYVWITDTSGNASYMNFEVNKIDKNAPKIKYEIDKSKLENEKYVTIKVSGTDDQVGLHEKPYSWDKENWGIDNNELKVTENGRHKIYVRDALENISEKEIIIKDFPQEGSSTIEEGSIIKEIEVSSDWNGNKNNAVTITLNNNLHVDLWKITETNEMPKEFNASEDENEVESEDLENNETQNEITNTIQDIIENQIENSNQTIVSVANNDLQGYTNFTVTVALEVDKKYYIWIKDTEGNVLSQAFSISKSKI